MPNSKCGLGVPSFKNRAERLRLGKRATLKNSKYENIRMLWQDSNLKNVNSDSLLVNNSPKAAKKSLIENQKNSAIAHFQGLTYQSNSVKIITSTLNPSQISHWSKVVQSMPGFIFNFTYKALLSQLPTRANLQRWGKAVTNSCCLCGAIQTNKHVLSNCSNNSVLDRFTARHNGILNLIANWLRLKLNSECKLFVDLPNSNFLNPIDLFTSVRPDISILRGNTVHVIELTVCHETNVIASRNYKLNKYRNLGKLKSEIIANYDVHLYTCELSVLGFLCIDETVFSSLHIPKIR